MHEWICMGMNWTEGRTEAGQGRDEGWVGEH